MNYYEKIKNELINNEVYKKLKDYSKNRSDLNTYYKVGKLLNDAGKSYGEGTIKKYCNTSKNCDIYGKQASDTCSNRRIFDNDSFG